MLADNFRIENLVRKVEYAVKTVTGSCFSHHFKPGKCEIAWKCP